MLTRELDFGLPIQVIDRQYLPTIDFDMCTVVVVIGQDGLVANTAKYVGDVPIIGVNPDPDRFDGVLLAIPPRSCPRRGFAACSISGRSPQM